MSDLVPADRYTARAIAPGRIEDFIITNKDETNYGVQVMCTITEGPHKGRTVPWVKWFPKKDDPKQVADMIERLVTAGARCKNGDIRDYEGLGSVEFSITVEHEEYNGKTRARVAWINRLSAGRAADVNKPALKSMLDKFAAIGRGVVAKVPSEAPKLPDDDGCPL